MSAQPGASRPGQSYGAYDVFPGNPPPGDADRVGVVIDGFDDGGAVQLRLGALSALEAATGPGSRRVLAIDRAAAPDWLAQLDVLQTITPSLLPPLIANLVDRLTARGADMDAGDASVAIESILLLTRTALERPTEPSAPSGAPADPDLLAAMRLIEERLLDPALDVGELMRALGISRSSLYRAFQPVGGVNAWIRQRRLEHARKLLADRTGLRPTVGEVAQVCGFASDSHFSRAFRKAFGRPPGVRA